MTEAGIEFVDLGWCWVIVKWKTSSLLWTILEQYIKL